MKKSSEIPATKKGVHMAQEVKVESKGHIKKIQPAKSSKPTSNDGVGCRPLGS